MLPGRPMEALPRGGMGAAIARNHTPIDTDAPCLATGTQADVLVQERCRCCVCGLRSNWGCFSTAANPNGAVHRVRRRAGQQQHDAERGYEARAATTMCGAVCKRFLIPFHQSQRSLRPADCRYAVTTLEAWTEIVARAANLRRRLSRSLMQ